MGFYEEKTAEIRHEVSAAEAAELAAEAAFEKAVAAAESANKVALAAAGLTKTQNSVLSGLETWAAQGCPGAFWVNTQTGSWAFGPDEDYPQFRVECPDANFASVAEALASLGLRPDQKSVQLKSYTDFY